jgi:hypothetical protein
VWAVSYPAVGLAGFSVVLDTERNTAFFLEKLAFCNHLLGT